MTKQTRIKYGEIQEVVVGDVPTYPRYVTQILNLANQTSQGTRARVVGQMSELIQQFDGDTVDDWITWYEERHPEARKNAADKIEEMIAKFRDAISEIDRNMIDTWVRDLVLYKTFVGLRFQEAILKKVADMKKTNYRLASPAEESLGIDGYIGYTPVSIKPITYKSMLGLVEEIQVEFIYYKKEKGGIDIYFDF